MVNWVVWVVTFRIEPDLVSIGASLVYVPFDWPIRGSERALGMTGIRFWRVWQVSDGGPKLLASVQFELDEIKRSDQDGGSEQEPPRLKSETDWNAHFIFSDLMSTGRVIGGS